MKLKIGGLFLVLGGSLWASRTLYNWLILDRLMNHGYAPDGLIDYLTFIVPLLCLAGLAFMLIHMGQEMSRVGKAGLVIAGLGTFLNSLFYFLDAYTHDLGVPFGLFILIPSILLLFIGLIMFALSNRQRKEGFNVFFILPLAHAILVLAFPLVSMFTTAAYGDEVATRWGVAIDVLIGSGWILLGYTIATVPKRRKSVIHTIVI